MAKLSAFKSLTTLIALFLLFIIIFIYYMYQYAISSPYLISSKKAKGLIRNKKIDIVLDVRTDIERDTLGFYPGSIHIQSSELEKKMVSKYPNRNLRIIVYCNTGQRARMATEILHKLGYKNAMYISTTYLSLI
jgi:phage shock protein E